MLLIYVDLHSSNIVYLKDPHKHKGLGKTGSKKQERVGLSGKERHQAESSSSK
jgi:hypothetical protein